MGGLMKAGQAQIRHCSVQGCERPSRKRGKCGSHYAHAWNVANRERFNDNWRRWYYSGGDVKTRTRRYGISQEEYEVLLEKQDGKCAICQRDYKAPCVDHDHETKKIRGLLCQTCNRALGQFNDDPALLRVAAEYLERAA